MKTAVEWLAEQITTVKWKMSDVTDRNSIIEQAKEMEKELLLHVIKCYHNNLFFVPLNENGEAEAILELILSGQIKSKLEI